MKVYFDNAASTPMDPLVIEEMVRVMQSSFGNPSSIHGHGRASRSLIEKARKTIAGLLHVAPSEIFFTSGGSESDNMAILSCVRDLGIKHIISSPLEHDAVVHALQYLEKRNEIKYSKVDVDEKGNISLASLEELLQQGEPALVSLMHANNELGTMTDIQAVSELCERYGALYHADTVQTMAHFPLDFSKLKIHFAACSGHKFHGPKGVGFIYVNADVKLKPLIFGGSQERNMRGGTENLSGIVGLAKAFEIAHSEMENSAMHIRGLKDYMKTEISKAIPGVTFNGETDPAKSLYTVLNVSLPEMEMADMLLFNLDIAGISASSGSACSSGTNIGSHVLDAIGAHPNRPAIRFSFSKLNTKEEVDYVVKNLKSIVLGE